MHLLHTHSGNATFFKEVFLHGALDVLKVIPFLLIAYLLMEILEHKASDKSGRFLEKAGPFAPLVGGTLGAIPQCGFSAAAANFYTGRVISMGTLVAVFLSTSDEMLPILISGRIKGAVIVGIILYKAAVGILAGFGIDLVLKLLGKNKQSINIDEICENDNCHCERGVVLSALHHTVTITLFIYVMTVAINTLVFFLGEDAIANVMYDKPFVSHLIASVIGLIPNCATSVALTNFAVSGFITSGTMLSGLFSGAGVGLLILFRMNKHVKENLIVVFLLIAVGTLAGLFVDLCGFGEILVPKI